MKPGFRKLFPEANACVTIVVIDKVQLRLQKPNGNVCEDPFVEIATRCYKPESETFRNPTPLHKNQPTFLALALTRFASNPGIFYVSSKQVPPKQKLSDSDYQPHGGVGQPFWLLPASWGMVKN